MYISNSTPYKYISTCIAFITFRILSVPTLSVYWHYMYYLIADEIKIFQKHELHMNKHETVEIATFHIFVIRFKHIKHCQIGSLRLRTVDDKQTPLDRHWVCRPVMAGHHNAYTQNHTQRDTFYHPGAPPGCRNSVFSMVLSMVLSIFFILPNQAFCTPSVCLFARRHSAIRVAD